MSRFRAAQRARVRKRANGKCEGCGKAWTPYEWPEWEVAHLKNKGMGGSSYEVPDDQLKWLCWDCHHGKLHRLRRREA